MALSPTLSFQFAKAKKLDTRITFTRVQSEPIITFMNANGYIEAAQVGAPRFQHDPISKICKGLLIEESKTNYLPWSNDFEFWGLNGATRIQHNGASPSGYVDADLITNSNNNGLIATSIDVTVSSTNDYFCSMYVKPMSGQTYVTLNCYYNYNAEDNVNFWFSDLSVTNAPYPNDVFMEKLRDGWYRIGYRMSRDGTGTRTTLVFRLWVSGRGVLNSDSCLVWGAQCEQGHFMTSLIMSFGAAKTRNADNAYVTGTNFSSWYNQTVGTFVAYGVEAKGSFPMLFNVGETTANVNNSHNVNIAADFNIIQYETYSAGVDVHHGTLAAGNSSTHPFLPYTAVSVLKTNDFIDANDEYYQSTDVSGTLPNNMTHLSIGSRNYGLYLNGCISALLYYNSKLSQEDIRSLSTSKLY